MNTTLRSEPIGKPFVMWEELREDELELGNQTKLLLKWKKIIIHIFAEIVGNSLYNGYNFLTAGVFCDQCLIDW